MSGYYNRNNRGITKKLGPVTAYADAVLAGYKGTREQWAQDMAKLGQNVTQVAQNTELTTELAEQTRENTEQVAKDTADVRRLADETSDNAVQVASNTEESNRLAKETKQAAAQAKADAEYAGAAADNFRVDTTLSEEGKAAEAKTTGEKFAQLSEEIVDTGKALVKYNAKTDKNILNLSQTLWEFGTIIADGSDEGEFQNRIRTADPVVLKPNTKYRLCITDNNYEAEVYLLTENGVVKFYSGGWVSDDFDFITTPSANYLKMVVRRSDNADLEIFDTLMKSGIIVTEHKEECFISGSKNHLNTADTRTHVRITDIPPYFVENEYGSIISHPIYVEGQDFITLKSNSYQVNGRWIAFCKDLSYKSESVISVVYGLPVETTGDSVVSVAIPRGAIYAFVTVFAAGGDEKWLNDTLSFGNISTNEKYERKGRITVDGELISINNQSDINDNTIITYNEVLRDETNRFNRVFVPYSVGSPNTGITFEQQHKRANLLFFTDSHIDLLNHEESLQNVKDTINFVNTSPIMLDAVVHGGDAITPFGESKETAKAKANMFFDELKKCRTPSIFAKGNHDTNDWYNPPSSVITDEEWGEMWLDYAEENYGIVRQTKNAGEKSTWHYYDIADKKIRIIAVDVQDADKVSTDSEGNVVHHGGVSWYISQEQMDWLINTALNFDNKADQGWGVIVVVHQDTNYSTITSPAYESAINKFFEVCVAFNNQTSYTSNYTFTPNNFYNLSINANFSRYSTLTEKPHMICWLIGHEHADKCETVNGINKIWLANGSATNHSSDDRLARIVGTATQNCFDVVNIDTVHRKIRCFRFGAGANCYGVGGDRFLPDGLTY